MLSPLAKRCVELLYKHKLSHVSSCLNTVDLLDEIETKRDDYDPVVLDNGHASVAHYVVLESRGYCDADEMIRKHGVHSSRDMKHRIWVSNGSLGQAATVALGLALADPERTVWLITSDGACMEGCMYEVFRIASNRVPNLSIHIVFNGYGAYGEIIGRNLPSGNATEHHVGHDYPDWLKGLGGHYVVLNKEQYEELMA